MKKIIKIVGVAAIFVMAFSVMTNRAEAQEIGIPEVVVEVIVTENTEVTCKDGIDNDQDASTDEADSDCVSFFPGVVVEVIVTENTEVTCKDGIDNDEDGASDEADINCAAFFPAGPVVEVIVTENTETLCKDGIDNDEDGASDEADINCAAFYSPVEAAPVNENTEALCKDGIDNDEDASTDEADSDCSQFFPTSSPETNNDGIRNSSGNGSSGGGGGGRRRNTSSSSNGNLPTNPQVLGATVGPDGKSCPVYISSYMKIGQANNSGDVVKLQTYLNKELNLNIPVTGFFGPITDRAVKLLQLKYKDIILAPWALLGEQDGMTPTGYVYKTTSWFINSRQCIGGTIPFPLLP